jgi:hypothetical protein
MNLEEIEKSIKTLAKFDLVVNKYSMALDEHQKHLPVLILDKTSYPGFEAHLFTVADATMWTPEINPDSDVVLTGPKRAKDPHESWSKLLDISNELLGSLVHYRQALMHGIIPSTHWVYHESRWYRENWEGPLHELKPAEDFLYSVDESIRHHIKELNDLGFPTTQSCSGLVEEHDDRDPYLPYVMFDERPFPRSSAHLFTLADIAGWIPSYGPHNFDIEFRLNTPDDSGRFWNSLIVTARRLAELLQEYRKQFE